VFLVWPHPDAKLSIEEMAKSYLPHLLAAQPSGAFCFGGFCNGGVLAWELAHQLETLGREIEYVVLIDTRSLNARLAFRAIDRLAKLVAVIARGNIRNKFKFNAMRAIWARVKQGVYYGPYFPAISNYVPPKLKCEIVAVLSEESRGLDVFSTVPWRHLSHKIRGYEFFTIPWRRLALKFHRRYEYTTTPWNRVAARFIPGTWLARMLVPSQHTQANSRYSLMVYFARGPASIALQPHPDSSNVLAEGPSMPPANDLSGLEPAGIEYMEWNGVGRGGA
jgi:Thioesterase domain